MHTSESNIDLKRSRNISIKTSQSEDTLFIHSSWRSMPCQFGLSTYYKILIVSGCGQHDFQSGVEVSEVKKNGRGAGWALFFTSIQCLHLVANNSIAKTYFCSTILTIFPPCLQKLFSSMFAFCNKIPLNQVVALFVFCKKKNPQIRWPGLRRPQVSFWEPPQEFEKWGCHCWMV